MAFIETQVESYDGCGSHTVYSIEWKKGVVLDWIGFLFGAKKSQGENFNSRKPF